MAVNCVECGMPLHPGRPRCDFCGADAPPPAPDALRQALGRVRERAAAVADRWNAARPAIPAVASRVPGRLWRAGGAVALAGLALALLAVLLRADGPGSPQPTADPARVDRGDERDARAALADSHAKEAALQAALEATQQRLGEVEAAQAKGAAEAATRIEAAETDITGLRQQVATERASLQVMKNAADLATRRIEALTECLNGTIVALQFGRTGAWGPADRALAAVAAACADAQALR